MTSSPIDLAYAAGVIDSDGYIGIHRVHFRQGCQTTYQGRVQVKQVSLPALNLLHNLFGGYRRFDMHPTTKNGRPLHVWAVHSAAAGIVCEALLPYLRIKPQQARNVIELCKLNRQGRSLRWIIPEVIPGEPMITMAEASRRLGKDYGIVIQAVKKGSVPHVRSGPRKVLIPESYLPIWATRGDRPRRSAEATARLETCYLLGRELNRVGV
jgi:hypothetical protein